jgi:uncharacterized protein YwgA
MAISRKEMLLALIGVEDIPVEGITRLQKYCFLAEREEKIKVSDKNFEFTKYHFGPYSSKLYDDLETLENYGLIETLSTNRRVDTLESLEAKELTADFLLGQGDQAEADAAQQEKVFQLTEKGKEFVNRLEKKGLVNDEITRIRKIKSKFSHYSLRDLIKYVYNKYPDMTTESEIKDLIL